MARLLAVDPGTRRVGLALSDPLQLIASPLATLAVKSEKGLIQQLLKIIRLKEVETVIIGLPSGEEGREGEICLLSRRLAAKLEARGVRTVLWEEGYSSRRAAELLREGGLNRKKAPEKVDRVAASVILADYLDRKEV